jgi:hypothetical protein
MLKALQKDIEFSKTQIIGQVIEALELLNDGIDELKVVAPDAIATLKAVVLEMFETTESQKGIVNRE